MKNNFYLILSFLFFAATSFGQLTFTDDFESYNVGDKLGSNSSDWTTWSGTTGGAEDADVVEGVALSGDKSIRFVGTGAQGGPQDVLLPFGGKYETGQFNFTMNIFIEEGSAGAYFNFQGQTTPGQDWVTQVWFEDNGVVRIEGATNGQTEASATYETGEWIEVSYDINLETNTWNIALNGDCVGSWTNELNALASLDLFPLLGQTFYVDDVSFTYTPDAVIPEVDLAIASVDMRPGGITGQEKIIAGTVKNNGTAIVTAYDVTISDGASSQTESYSGLSIMPGAQAGFQFSLPYTIKEGQTEVSVKVSNVNGGIDESECNDAANSIVTGVTPAPGRKVVAEEGTGTWCQWCPRGEVFMNLMADEYGSDYFVGIAVHNGDPMAVAEHDDGLTALPAFSGFPGVAIDRLDVIDPSDIELAVLNRLTVPAAATLMNGASYDASTGELQVSVTADFSESVSGDYRLNVVVVEDGVTGTGSGYNQSNAYAGGSNGSMGGYEFLPSSVPASQMVYDHVSRAILGGFGGDENSLPDDITAGESHAFIYSVILPEEFDLSEIKIASMLIEPNGTINNGEKVTLEEALANGLAVSTEEVIASAAIQTFPNPFNETLNVTLDLEEAVNVSTRLYTTAGQLVDTQSFGNLNGKTSVQLNTNDLAEGMYILNVVLDKQIVVRKVNLVK